MSLGFTLYVEVDLGGETPYCLEPFDANYTHNVVPMWEKAGVYEALYKSDGKQAKEIIPELEIGYEFMKNNPDLFIPLNPPNGWGDYETALEFLNNILDSCKKYPKTIIQVS